MLLPRFDLRGDEGIDYGDRSVGARLAGEGRENGPRRDYPQLLVQIVGKAEDDAGDRHRADA